MPTGMQLLRQQRGPLAKSFSLTGSGGATREIEVAGKVLAIWGLKVETSTATAATISLQNQAGTVLWLLRTVAVSGAGNKQMFDPPLISENGLQAVTTGGATLDINVIYSLVDET